MKILHLIDSGGLYGAERVLLQLAAEFARRGHEVLVGTIIAPTDDSNELGAAARALGLEVVEFRMPNGMSRRGIQSIRSFLRARSIDVVHGHGYKANIFVALLSTRPRQIATVATLHGWTSTVRLSKMALYETTERFLLRRLDRVVAVSPLIAAQVERRLQSGRLQLIWNALPELAASDAPLDQMIVSFCRRAPTIVAIGRLSREKGFDILVRALHRARATIANLQLLILGEGPERPALQRLLDELQISQHVLLPGYRQDATRYFEHCSVFALSSLTEGLPLVLLEAMAHRIPIVATDVGAIRPVLRDGECGRLVPAGDIATLAQALQAAVADADQSAMLDAAQRVVRENHSASRMADAYEVCYSAARSSANAFEHCSAGEQVSQR